MYFTSKQYLQHFYYIHSQCLCRYERLWLPLAAKGECEGAAPPLDVHWVWLVHMLAPQHYHQDCQAVAGTQVHHRLMTSKVGSSPFPGA